MKAQILELLRKYTNHNHIKLTCRGNMAIFFSTYFAKKLNSKAYFLVPDEGGWLTYKTYPKIFNLNVHELKTNNAVIDLDELKKFAQKSSALIYSNPGGYFCEQPMKEIYDICNNYGCLVILDASGSIGTEMCKGEYADFIIGSFGKWKPVNAEYGGFISAKNEFPDLEIFKMDKIDEDKLPTIYEKLKTVSERIKSFINTAEKVKKDLSNYNILSKESKSINVVIEYNNDEEKEKLIKYCTDNEHQYTMCPRYIRTNLKAISIEIKRQ